MRTKLFLGALLSLAIIGLIWLYFLPAPQRHSHDHHGHGHEHEHEHEEEEVERGPHGGRLLTHDDFSLELLVFEPGGILPEYHAYAYEHSKPVDPSKVALEVTLQRLNRKETLHFVPEGGFLIGDKPVVEPHSFEAKVDATYQDQKYQWEFTSFEERATISEEAAKKNHILVEEAGPMAITETVSVTGHIDVNEEDTTPIVPRYPGVLRSVRKQLGDTVQKGEVLALVESNESLQDYEIKSPMNGVILKKNASEGQYVSGQEQIYLLGDLGTVWADFILYAQDYEKIKKGQTVLVKGTNGGETTRAVISYISPLGVANTQSTVARAVLENKSHQWRPGLFITGEIIIDRTEVSVAVRTSALQKVRDWDAVYIQVGDTYEAAPLELGKRDKEYVEVRSGLSAGEKYVYNNSFLIKAEIGKSSATHEH